MVTLQQIAISSNGQRLNYHYLFPVALSKYFSAQLLFVEYVGKQISVVPDSIKVIPFVANMLPISWFVGFNVHVKELDEDFFNSAMAVKSAFAELYPGRVKENTQLVCDRLVKNTFNGTECALLFSGGIDAYTTFIRHRNENPLLVTIHGADISISDEFQWQLLEKRIQTAKMIADNRGVTIKTNMRRFYSLKVNELMDDLDWWGRIQHAFAMLTLMAPLSVVENINKLYIASSATKAGTFKWGSSPNIDSRIRWADVNIVHDAYDLDRFEKVKLLVETARAEKRNIQVKVCYQVGQVDVNCSKCDKCLRSIILFICAGADPNNFGFSVDRGIYERVTNLLKKGFENDASQYVWKVVLDAIESRDQMFYFSSSSEEARLNQVGVLIRQRLTGDVRAVSNTKQVARKLQLKYPWIADLKSKVQRLIARLTS